VNDKYIPSLPSEICGKYDLTKSRKRTQKAKEAEKLELKLREQEKQTGFEGSFLGKTYAGKEEKGCV